MVDAKFNNLGVGVVVAVVSCWVESTGDAVVMVVGTTFKEELEEGTLDGV